jgi:hypothetical protein
MTRRPLLRDRSGASAAEFALVLPLLLLLLFGIVDGGRFLWDFNRAEKATQVGARVAIVTNTIPSGLYDADYVGEDVTMPDGSTKTLTQGDVIPAGALGDIECTRDSCACAAGPCPDDVGTLDTSVFDSVLLPRMQAMYPPISACNVVLHYRGSGLGFAGDPNGMQIAPMVTVELKHTANTCPLEFRPITSLLFASLPMPDFASTLTAEDSSGTASN